MWPAEQAAKVTGLKSRKNSWQNFGKSDPPFSKRKVERNRRDRHRRQAIKGKLRLER